MRPRLAAAAALAALLAPALARADDLPAVPSPLRVESDHNGVNLVTGQMTMEMPALSAPGASRLRFDRVQNAAPYFVGNGQGSPGEGTLLSVSVQTGTGASESFKCEGGTCEPASGSRDTATGTGSTFGGHTYTQAGTGARWYFDRKHTDNIRTAATGGFAQYYASSISYPDGEAISFTYDQATLAAYPGRTYYRPVTISSSLGYHIALTYQGSDINQVGWGTVATAALYRSDSTPQLIRRLVYDGSSIIDYGSNAADVGGRTYTCTGCISTLGLPTETAGGSQRLPGESSDSLQVIPSTQAGVSAARAIVGTVIRDGDQWNYSYANLRYDLTSKAYWYDSVTVTGPENFSQVYGMTVLNRRNVLQSVRDSIQRTMAFQFDPLFRPILITRPETDKVAVVYDDYGNVTSRTATPKSGLGSPVTESALYRSDCATTATSALPCYRPTWSRDGLGRQTDYVWNDSGQLIEQTDPADQNGFRRKTYISYETSLGVSRKSVVRMCLLGSTCGTGQEIRTEYQYWGQTFLPSVERRIDAASGITLETTYSYDAAGRPLSVDGPLPGTDDARYSRYDGYGRKTWEIGARSVDGLRIATRFTYRDSDDRLLYSEMGTVPDAFSTALTILRRTDLAYDDRRNPVRESVSAGGTTYTMADKSFDGQGRQTCAATRMNKDNFPPLSLGACALGAPGSFGPDRITHNVYDAAGQLLQVQRAYGITTANGFPATLQQNEATYEYSPNGKRKAVTDANGNRAEMTYDGFDRQSRWIFPSTGAPGRPPLGQADPSDYEQYGYDLAGNRLTLRKRDGTTIGYAYDALNRVTVKTVPASASGAPGYSVHYGYDVRGLLTSARFGSASGPGIGNSYDGFGRLTSSTTTMDGVARTYNSQYDAAGNRIMLWNNGYYYIASFAYDALDRMTTAREGGGAVVGQIAYDSAGRRSSLGLGTGGAVTSSAGYLYDPVSRLQTLSRDLAGAGADESRSFAWNPASQVVARTISNDAYASNIADNVSRPYSVNGLNQYIAAGPVSFTYDANGNLTGDGSTAFVYDSENRLVSASGAKNAALAYDPLGRLWQISSGSGTTRFVYDGDRLTEEFDGSGGWLRAYIHGPGPDEPLVWYELTAGMTRYFLHADHQGSIVALADLNGNAATINGYDPWGIPNAGNAGRFQYTGQVWLAELGLYYYKARFYSPTLGRFLQTDPVGYEDQVNLYAYVGNDPMNRTDPTGMAEDDETRRARQTLRQLMGAVRREIRTADEAAAGSRLRASSDSARIAGLRNQLAQLRSLNPADLARLRVTPNGGVSAGITNAMRGAVPETAFGATRTGAGVSYGRLSQTSQTEDSGQANSTPGLVTLGHRHAPGGGREYPGVGDPGNVLVHRVPNVYAEGGNSNAIGWNGSRFTLTNVEGAAPSYGSAPSWIRDTFEPW